MSLKPTDARIAIDGVTLKMYHEFSDLMKNVRKKRVRINQDVAKLSKKMVFRFRKLHNATTNPQIAKATSGTVKRLKRM
jgi:predicted translin family RNA/ssDNA-binding protein